MRCEVGRGPYMTGLLARNQEQSERESRRTTRLDSRQRPAPPQMTDQQIEVALHWFSRFVLAAERVAAVLEREFPVQEKYSGKPMGEEALTTVTPAMRAKWDREDASPNLL